MSDWQPIETATTDRQILVTDGKLVGAAFLCRRPLWCVISTMNELPSNHKWLNATHWMPLPDPPK